MDNNFELSMLLDFYGSLLTDKQRDIADLYYNGDYSLGEIAQDLQISRQGVRDSLKRAETQLRSFEEKIGFMKKYSELNLTLAKIKLVSNDAMSSLNSDDMFSALESIYNLAKISDTTEGMM